MIKRYMRADGRLTWVDDDKRTLAEIEAEEKESTTRVYFIQCQTTKLIKIGIARDVSMRFLRLQSMCTSELKLITSIRGGRHIEILLHRRFALARRHGEWFRPVPALLSLIGVEMEYNVRYAEQKTARKTDRGEPRKKPPVEPRTRAQKESSRNPLQDLMVVTGLSEHACKRAIDAGELPGYKDGQTYVVPEFDLTAWCHGRWRPRAIDE